MSNVVKLPNGLSRFWARFVQYTKVGICLALILFLFQSIVSGLGGTPRLEDILFRAGFLLILVLGGSAGIALAHEMRRPKRRKDDPQSWRKQVPW